MRALSRALSRTHAAAAPYQPALRRDGPHVPGLTALYVPVMVGAGASNQKTDLINLAYSPAAGVPAPRFIRRTASGNNTKIPTSSDRVGPYWDATGNLQRWMNVISADGTLCSWRPGDNGGHAPGTLLVVVLLIDTFVNEGAFSWSANSGATEFGIGFGVSTGVRAYGYIATGTGQRFYGDVLSLGAPHAVVFTTRGPTDHHLHTRNLVTGVIGDTASSANSGSTGINAANLRIGARGLSSPTELGRAQRIYLCASWARSMTTAEMRAVAMDPFGLVAPALVPRGLNSNTPPPPALFPRRQTLVFG